MDSSPTPKSAPVRPEQRCGRCGHALVPIVYGMPSGDLIERAERGEVVLGGCCIVGEDPTHSCPCGATTRRERGDERAQDPHAEDLGFGVGEARDYIANVRWQFAKTMPQWPHEYTVRDWRPDLSDHFEAFASFIRSGGVVKPWPADSPTPRYHHSYLAIDGWDYWTMGEPIVETEVINRARLDGT